MLELIIKACTQMLFYMERNKRVHEYRHEYRSVTNVCTFIFVNKIETEIESLTVTVYQQL